MIIREFILLSVLCWVNSINVVEVVGQQQQQEHQDTSSSSTTNSRIRKIQSLPQQYEESQHYQRQSQSQPQQPQQQQQQQQQQQSDNMSEQRDLASLQEKWALQESGFSYQNLSFALDFTASDFILNTMATAIVYTDACQEGNITIPSSELSSTLVPDSTPEGVGDVNRTFTVDITMDTNNIVNSATYSENTVGNVTAQVKFCVRFGLWTNSVPAIEVNFLETLVTLNIDLTDGFEINDVSVAARDQLVRTATQAYEVVGYQCDRNNVKLEGQALSESRNQGEIIRVCVTPNQDAIDDGVFMRYIDSFSWQRDYGGSIGVITQAAIVDRLPADNDLTELECIPGSLVCSFQSILFASMYRTPGAVTGSGIASMQLGDQLISRRRQLERSMQMRGSYNTRQLQQDDDDDDELVAAVSEFDIDMEVVPVYNPYLAKYREKSSFATTAMPTSLALTIMAVTLGGMLI
jgi:hypothetical protein